MILLSVRLAHPSLALTCQVFPSCGCTHGLLFTSQFSSDRNTGFAALRLKSSAGGIMDHRHTTRSPSSRTGHRQRLEPTQCEGRATEQDLVARVALENLLL